MTHGMLDLDGRCVLSDLLPEQCAGCLGHDGFDDLDDADLADPARRHITDLFDVVAEVTFTARYGGKCTACGDGFRAGDTIGRVSAGGHVCSGCAA